MEFGAPQDSMQSDNENEETTAPGLGLSAAYMMKISQPPGKTVGECEAESSVAGVASKMSTIGTSIGSALNMRKSCIRLVLM